MTRKIMNIMNDIQYGYLDKNDKIHYDDYEMFSDLYKLQSPEETLKNKIGVCWDQVELERHLFEKENIDFKTYFIIHYDNDKCPTHTFLIYKKDDKYYWFEHSWEKHRGIKSFASKLDALEYIKEMFITDELKNQCDSKNLYIYEYVKPEYGINALKFISHCEKGNKITKY